MNLVNLDKIKKYANAAYMTDTANGNEKKIKHLHIKERQIKQWKVDIHWIYKFCSKKNYYIISDCNEDISTI